MVGLAKRRESERVFSRAVEGKEYLAIGLKQFPESIGCCRGPGIITVAGNVAAVGSFHRGPHLWTNAGIVIARKLLNKIGAVDIRHIFPILGCRQKEPGTPSTSSAFRGIARARGCALHHIAAI